MLHPLNIQQPLRARHKGFTVLELTMVIVVIGVLAAVALPKYVDLTAQSKTVAAHENADTVNLRYTSLIALATQTPASPQTPAGWLFDSAANVYYDPAVNNASTYTAPQPTNTWSWSGSLCGIGYTFTGTAASIAASAAAAADSCVANNTFSGVNESNGHWNFVLGGKTTFPQTSTLVNSVPPTTAPSNLPLVSAASAPMFPSDGVCSYTGSSGTYTANAQDPDCAGKPGSFTYPYPNLDALVDASIGASPAGPNGWLYDAASKLFYDPAVNSASTNQSHSIFDCQSIEYGVLGEGQGVDIDTACNNFAISFNAGLGDSYACYAAGPGCQCQTPSARINFGLGCTQISAGNLLPPVSASSPPAFPSDGVCSYILSSGGFVANPQDPDCSGSNPISCPAGAKSSSGGCVAASLLPEALDHSGVCVAENLKTPTWKDKEGLSPTATGTDIVVRLDTEPVADATNCPGTLFPR